MIKDVEKAIGAEFERAQSWADAGQTPLALHTLAELRDALEDASRKALRTHRQYAQKLAALRQAQEDKKAKGR